MKNVNLLAFFYGCWPPAVWTCEPAGLTKHSQEAVGIDMSAPLPFTFQTWLLPLAVFLIMRQRALPLNAVA
jgi:hypothetical protein